MRQVEKGTYRQVLPTGLERLEDGRVVKHPDAHVRRAIALIFERFALVGDRAQGVEEPPGRRSPAATLTLEGCIRGSFCG